MLRNYIKIAWRNLWKQPGFTLINLFGLSAGLTCFIFIVLWINNELSYDKFNKNYKDIFRVTTIEKTDDGIFKTAKSGAPVGNALSNNFPEIENYVRLKKQSEIVQHNNEQTMQSDIILTDPSFFEIFSYRLIKGNLKTALLEPYTVILTQSTAKKYFGKADPIGEVLTIYMYDTGKGANYKVTGIVPDPPKNAHFTFTMLCSFKTIESANPDILASGAQFQSDFYTYLLLKDGVNYTNFSKKIPQFFSGIKSSDPETKQSKFSLALQPLRDIHLHSNLNDEIAANGDIKQIYVFSTIGIFILLLAGINYTNLSTVRSIGRAKEVGIKKVIGAVKSELIIQYLVESIFITTIALLLSFVLAFTLQSHFAFITGKNLSVFSSPLLILFLVIVSVFLGFLSGIYPAFVISSFKPAGILKGAFKSSTQGIILRKSLVTLQLVITIILIISIVVIDSQLVFVKNKNLGYDKNALLIVRVNGNSNVIRNYRAFKDELSANPLVSGLATSNSLILNGLEDVPVLSATNKGKPSAIRTSKLQVDEDYLKVHGIKLLAGKNFSSRATGDSIRPCILNKKAVLNFGWKTAQEAIGKPLMMDNEQGIVVGVVQDFHFNSLQYAINPLLITLNTDYFSRITIKIDPNQTKRSLTLIQGIWSNHFSDALFDYDFVDDLFEDEYRVQERFSTIVTFFSILSILIACFGLFGLISYSTSQRTKEIGIRKVLGASAAQITTLLSTGFLRLVLIAILIASPIAWYAMNKWLQEFAYRIDMEWWMFALAGLLAILISLATVSYQTIRAALANPVKSLRTE